MSSKDLLSTAEAATELDISPRRVRQLIDLEILPAKHIGRSLVIERRHLPAARGRKTKPGRATKAEQH